MTSHFQSAAQKHPAFRTPQNAATMTPGDENFQLCTDSPIRLVQPSLIISVYPSTLR
jgi:hypothetical protein